MYDVRKSKGSDKWYVIDPGGMPVTNPMDKKKALHIAADRSGMDYKEYMKVRRCNGGQEV